ncbi:MAG: prepilin-type N-terminal cleavage/methylation domain-containing protein [Oscillospiraceae bacterium]|nr:prepilin-type N-terminal cleavage/methylation domain-containing protein [Oscillospiraceae bacterium]
MSRSREGFTLVELIVVIAILAILAGVGIPVYSGYIKKANEAADQQLLGVINTAFGAACLENDTNAAFFADGSVSFDLTTMLPSEFEEDFATYFAGNNGTFKTIEALYFANGVFSADEMITVEYKGTTITLRGSDIQNFKSSSFADIGADKLLTMVGMASGMIDITKVDSSTLAQLATSPEAMAFFYQKLGVTSKMELAPTLMSKYPQGDMNDDEYNAYLDEKYNQMVANSAVLYAAQKSQAASEGIWDVLKADSVKDAIKDNDNADEMLAQSAMAFAMYSAYTKTNSLEGVQLNDVYTTLDSDEFKAYLDTDQAKADLNGYLSSMDMINDGVSSDPAAAKDILINGFGDQALADLITGLVG